MNYLFEEKILSPKKKEKDKSQVHILKRTFNPILANLVL